MCRGVCVYGCMCEYYLKNFFFSIYCLRTHELTCVESVLNV